MSELMFILSGRPDLPQTGAKPDSSRPDGNGHAAFLAFLLPPAGERVADDAAVALPAAPPPVTSMEAAAPPWPARPDGPQDDGYSTFLAANAPQSHASPDTGTGPPPPETATTTPDLVDLAPYSLIPTNTETSLSPVDPTPSDPAVPPFPTLGGGIVFAASTPGQPMPSIAPTPRHSDTQTQPVTPQPPGWLVQPTGAPLPLHSIEKSGALRKEGTDIAPSPVFPRETATADPETLAAPPLSAPHPVVAPTLPRPDDTHPAPRPFTIAPFPPPQAIVAYMGIQRGDPPPPLALASHTTPSPNAFGTVPALNPTQVSNLSNPEPPRAEARPAPPQGPSLAPAPLGAAQATPAQAVPPPAIPQAATPGASMFPAPPPPPIITPIPGAAKSDAPAPSPTPNTAPLVQPPGLAAPPAISAPLPARDPIPDARITDARATDPLPPAPAVPPHTVMRGPLASAPPYGGPKPAPTTVDLARPAPADIPLGVEAAASRVADPPPNGPPPTAPSAPQATAVAAQILRTLQDDAPRSPGAPIDIALDPPELGRLRLALTEVNGTLTLSIVAERPETADLIRRHLALLADEFLRSGLDAPSVQVSHQGAGGGGSGRAPLPHQGAADGATGPAPPPAPAPNRATVDGLDLRL
ncbi:flagellar hook-length control protein FliK [Roseicyclus marinus]|uniref:flagellar hook-length control protein FliK n=1 Tax=Roseicyclus marinus TaxID=2161673 RepID=UPI00240F05C1|nr:flagellar hook-length control protein FliK [Roseicyclus marinus]MDG3041345.1 flagellar hook-length control protein FliK [Roseicyclus marinus]